MRGIRAVDVLCGAGVLSVIGGLLLLEVSRLLLHHAMDRTSFIFMAAGGISYLIGAGLSH